LFDGKRKIELNAVCIEGKMFINSLYSPVRGYPADSPDRAALCSVHANLGIWLALLLGNSGHYTLSDLAVAGLCSQPKWH
jgi:hypothetical protein